MHLRAAALLDKRLWIFRPLPFSASRLQLRLSS
jgi:hypothetical protein